MATGRVPTTANSPLTAKGDLFGYSTTQARVAVGNNGETLVADSSATTGLRYQVTQAAGKNYIINGGMDFWQRGTSYALPATTINYGAADRWCYYSNAVTGRTASRQTASLAGFTYSQRIQRDSGNTNTQSTQLVQLIESSVATSLQGQYVTVSFWAKAGANYSVASSNITVVLYAGTGTDQNPYTTGYTGQTTPISTSQAITTSWAKYSFTTSAVLASSITELTLAIQSGAFVGTAGANDWFEVTGVQLEAGQTGTLFTRAGGTIQGELAACQRYYEKTYIQGVAPATSTSEGVFIDYGSSDGSGTSVVTIPMQVAKRNVSYSVAIYTTGGTASNWAYARSGASGNVAMTIDLKSERTFRAYGTTGANWVVTTLNGHWVVDNEL
jgi:hypothetical protein